VPGSVFGECFDFSLTKGSYGRYGTSTSGAVLYDTLQEGNELNGGDPTLQVGMIHDVILEREIGECCLARDVKGMSP